MRDYLLLFLLLPLTLGPAQEKKKTTLPPDPARGNQAERSGEDPLLATTGKVMTLSLEECLTMARRDNLALQADRYNLPLTREAVRVAAGTFWSPTLYLNADYGEQETAPTDLIQKPKIESESYGFTTGFQWKALWTGAVMDLSYRHRYNDFEVFYPTLATRENQALWNPVLALTLTQPLLKGAWLDYNRADIRQAELEAERADQSHQDLVQETLLQATRAYWNLVYTREFYRVRKLSLETARDQLRITEQRIQASLAAPVERIANQADIARRRQDLIGARNQLLQAGDTLKALIFPFREDREWQVRIIPTSPLEEKLDFPIPPTAEAARKAMQKRRDLEAARLAVTSAQVRVDQSRNLTRPRLDLVGSYAAEAAGEHTDDFAKEILEGRFPAWSLGLEFSYPLGNISARAELRRARLALEQAQCNRRRREVAVWQEVREAVRNLRSLRQEIDAGRESVRLAESNLKTEEEKFRVGKSIAFEVQRRNDDLADARARLVEVTVRFRTGIVALKRAMGGLE